MSNPQPAIGFHCSKSMVHTDNCPYFNNLDFHVFDAGGPQCHFIASVTIMVRIRTLSVHWPKTE